MKRELLEATIRLPADYWWLEGKHMMCWEAIGRNRDLGSGARVLDVGAGGGEWLEYLRSKSASAKLFGVDSALPAASVLNRKGYRVAVASANALPFRAGSFDVVAGLDVYEHLDDDLSALGEAGRILRPGGRLLMHVPAHPSLFSYWDEAAGHKRRYTKRGLGALLVSAGFELLCLDYAHALPFAPAAVVRTVRAWQGGEKLKKASAHYDDVPRLVRSILMAGYRCEVALRKFAGVPVGLSLIAVGRRR